LQEAVILTQIRGEIIRQNEFIRDCAYIRRIEARQFWAKFGFSVLATGTGIGLVTAGFTLEGFVTLGIGFHWLAPDFVRGVFDRVLGARDKNNAD
jgi:hypothetical protein